MTDADDIDDRGNSAEIFLLADTACADLPLIASVDDVPASARIVVVDQVIGNSTAIVRALRNLGTELRLVAWIREPSDDVVRACYEIGYDEAIVGVAQLEHSPLRWRAELDRLDASIGQSDLHRRLVSLIDEIAEKPTLGDVLRIAVLRMSQLFDIDRVSVVLFTPGDEIGFVVMENEDSLLDNLVVRLADYPEIGRIIETREPLVISDVLGDTLLSGVRSKLEHAKVPPHSAVLFPLVRKRDVVGALFLRSAGPVQVEDRLVDMGRLIASVTSVAIGSALEHDTLVSEQRALMRKKAEADEKLAGLQPFSEFFAQAHDGIVVSDEDGVMRYANPAAGEILGREPEDLVGRKFLELLGERSLQVAERAMRGDDVGDAYGYVDLLVPVGGEHEVVVSAAIRKLEDPKGVLVSFRDVTELREIETELRQTKEFLENLIQSSVDAIVAADIEGRVILFNRAAERFLGYQPHEVVGKLNVTAMYPPGDAYDIMRRLRSDAYGGKGRLEMIRKELVAKDGSLVPVNLTASVIYEEGREVATVGIFTDLRERLKIEEKLAKIQNQLQSSERQAVAIELAGAAAHELNQPLTSILGYAEILKRRMPDNERTRKPVDVICRETERMASIVRKIGQITAYETKPYVGSSKILDLGEDSEEGEPSEGGEST
ncbi:MAG: PAS domain S-box protein [Myxococcota bacterium]